MKQLFIDDHHIEEMNNLARILHQPVKQGAVVQPQYRWENIGVHIQTSPMWDPDEQLFK